MYQRQHQSTTHREPRSKTRHGLLTGKSTRIRHGPNATVQINIISTNGALFRKRHVHQHRGQPIRRLIRVNTGSNPTIVSVDHGTFEHANGSGIAVDAYGATGLSLTIENSTFDMGNTKAVRLPPGAVAAAHIDHNDYHRADSGHVFEVQDRDYFTEFSCLRFTPIRLGTRGRRVGR